jgi:hypothetical protein
MNYSICCFVLLSAGCAGKGVTFMQSVGNDRIGGSAQGNSGFELSDEYVMGGHSSNLYVVYFFRLLLDVQATARHFETGATFENRILAVQNSGCAGKSGWTSNHSAKASILMTLSYDTLKYLVFNSERLS